MIDLFEKNFLKITFPPQYINTKFLQNDLFEEYCFELSDNGKKNYISILIENGILGSLIQDGRTAELIQHYLEECCNIVIETKRLENFITYLFEKKLLKIAFPPQYINTKFLQNDLFEEYWFELSEAGEEECKKRNLMIQ